EAVKRGVELPDAELPRFPKAVRWERDPDFDARATALRTVRDAAATRLDLDPGVLCSRDRLEAVARRNPTPKAGARAIQQLPQCCSRRLRGRRPDQRRRCSTPTPGLSLFAVRASPGRD